MEAHLDAGQGLARVSRQRQHLDLAAADLPAHQHQVAQDGADDGERDLGGGGALLGRADDDVGARTVDGRHDPGGVPVEIRRRGQLAPPGHRGPAVADQDLDRLRGRPSRGVSRSRCGSIR